MTTVHWVLTSKNISMSQREKEVNGQTFHEREDHNHVLKRITSCARAGTIPSIGLQYFRDALHDENSGMTYEALTGKRKQSVPDCEKFSPLLSLSSCRTTTTRMKHELLRSF